MTCYTCAMAPMAIAKFLGKPESMAVLKMDSEIDSIHSGLRTPQITEGCLLNTFKIANTMIDHKLDSKTILINMFQLTPIWTRIPTCSQKTRRHTMQNTLILSGRNWIGRPMSLIRGKRDRVILERKRCRHFLGIKSIITESDFKLEN